MARRKGKTRGWRLYLAATLVLALAIAAGWYWWTMRSWAPDVAEFPDQGIVLGPGESAFPFQTIAALDGKFVYFGIGPVRAPRDTALPSAFTAARRARLQVGAVIPFDPCEGADIQSARYVTMVARDDDLLPPVIALQTDADRCLDPVSDAAVESELVTLINQLELHAGKPVILRLSPGFERRYGIAGKISRDLWLVSDRIAPRYAGRPWLLWSANQSRHIEAVAEPVEWVVVQP